MTFEEWRGSELSQYSDGEGAGTFYLAQAAWRAAQAEQSAEVKRLRAVLERVSTAWLADMHASGPECAFRGARGGAIGCQACLAQAEIQTALNAETKP